ncbi:MAG: polyamine aminopropyltransferase, partial [Myxococcales bacterium]|nr:polyamine aminopropyltransferase [Myxococcales bacterium]
MAGDWYDEIHDDRMRIGFRIRGVLFDQQSRYQRVTVVETEMLGNALLIDGIWMTAAGDEKSYHELITHPALCSAPSIARVLVIGGG